MEKEGRRRGREGEEEGQEGEKERRGKGSGREKNMFHDCHSYYVEESKFYQPTHHRWYTGSPSGHHCGLFIKKYHTRTTEHDRC